MILEQLVIENFGVYGGRHEINLHTQKQKPIVLVGGLNGGGKTTILDALQLALYGRLAQCSNRGDLPYEEFLRRSTHHGAETAAVELEFKHTSEGEERTFRVRRSWSVRNKTTRERLEVKRGGDLDQVLTEAWAEQVEEFIPVRLSKFFFFDGEKIESLADLERSAEVLSTAIHSLLGLDLVDQLGTDLLVLERRKRLEQKTVEEREIVESARREVDALKNQLDDFKLRRATAHNAVERAQKKLKDTEARFKREGGEALEQQKELEKKRGEVDGRIHAMEEQLVELAGEAPPLMLIMDLVDAMAADVEAERAAAGPHDLLELLDGRDKRTLEAAVSLGATNKVIAALRQFLEADRKRYARPAEGESGYLRLSSEAQALLSGLRAQLRGELPRRIENLLKQFDEQDLLLDEIDRKTERVPAQDAIESLLAARTEAQEALFQANRDLAQLDEEIERLTREHDNKCSALARLMERDAEEHFKQLEVSRVLTYSEKVRGTLKQFRAAVIERHVKRIEGMILESFQHLLRKESLVSGLEIDPRTFSMALFGRDRGELPPERLSAGERQLLAVSTIWGLARASGRPLPVVIDTPLGRLDSVHRWHMVERYFPHASHQVVLLSTDKEIDGAYYEKLQPHIGRSYLLKYDDSAGSTRIDYGYFW